jgi:hypothetical protein
VILIFALPSSSLKLQIYFLEESLFFAVHCGLNTIKCCLWVIDALNWISDASSARENVQIIIILWHIILKEVVILR